MEEGPFPGRLWSLLGPSSIPRGYLSTIEEGPASEDPRRVTEGAGAGAKSRVSTPVQGDRAETRETLRLGVPQALGDRSRP